MSQFEDEQVERLGAVMQAGHWSLRQAVQREWKRADDPEERAWYADFYTKVFDSNIREDIRCHRT